MRESAAEALDASAAGFSDLPLVTISQTDPGAYRMRQQEALALLSTRGQHLVAANSGHWIPIEEPAIVVAALKSVTGETPGRQWSHHPSQVSAKPVPDSGTKSRQRPKSTERNAARRNKTGVPHTNR